jgi:hypothetical protein
MRKMPRPAIGLYVCAWVVVFIAKSHGADIDGTDTQSKDSLPSRRLFYQWAPRFPLLDLLFPGVFLC